MTEKKKKKKTKREIVVDTSFHLMMMMYLSLILFNQSTDTFYRVMWSVCFVIWTAAWGYSVTQ